MDTNKIQPVFDETMTELIQLVDAFGQDEINIVPFEGSWTAGELAQHLVISGSGFLQMINGPIKDTQRSPDEMEDKIKSTFLDFNTKMKSPDFVVPPKKAYDKEELLQPLKDIHEGISKGIKTLDLSKTCTAFELPFYGFLTRYESISFVLYHTQRHVRQLKNVWQKVLARQYETEAM